MSLSKRAEEQSKIKQMVGTLWKPDYGFFENLFRIAPYVAPFFGVPWWQVIAAAVGGHLLGISTSDLGRFLDQKLNTTSEQVPSLSQLLGNLEEVLMANKKEAGAASNFTKRAGLISALLKSGKLVGMFLKGVSKLIAGLLGLYAVATTDDLIREITKPVRATIPTLIPETTETQPPEVKTNKVDVLIDNIKQKYNLNEG